MIFERRQNACKTLMKKPNNQSELKIVSSSIRVMQAFHRMRILKNERNIKKLQKPKPNRYIQNDFHISLSKINHKKHKLKKPIILKHKT